MTTHSAFAAPGDEVVVIFNSKLPESKEVAEYYAGKRQVPQSQVIGLPMTAGAEMSRAEYQDQLEQPLLKLLVDRKLWRLLPDSAQSKTAKSRVAETAIRYFVLAYGVPFKITGDSVTNDAPPDISKPELLRNGAAVDSELACLAITRVQHPLTGYLRNSFYSVTNSGVLHPTNGIVMVARLDGPALSVAQGLVDKALEAERDGLWGRAYFDLRGISDPAYKLGDDWLRRAAEIVRRLGFETYIDEKPNTLPAGFPLSQVAFYMGWYDENVSGPFLESKVEFMPGAFAYHLHSFNAARLRTPEQGWVGPLLAKGATITMGSVDEPYLAGTPDLAAFAARLVYDGWTFGEAAYASQTTLSWQSTVIGDPLYRPFGKNPDVLRDELDQRNSKLLDWAYLRLLDVNLANGRNREELLAFLENLELRKHSAVLTEKLADMYSALGKPSSAIFTYQQALKLDPSRMQRLGLRLTLGDKLREAGRPAEAYDDYKQLLVELPSYADKISVLKKMQELAVALNNSTEAADLSDQINRLLLKAP